MLILFYAILIIWTATHITDNKSCDIGADCEYCPFPCPENGGTKQ